MWILNAFGTLEVKMSCYKIPPAKTLQCCLIDGLGDGREEKWSTGPPSGWKRLEHPLAWLPDSPALPIRPLPLLEEVLDHRNRPGHQNVTVNCVMTPPSKHLLCCLYPQLWSGRPLWQGRHLWSSHPLSPSRPLWLGRPLWPGRCLWPIRDRVVACDRAVAHCRPVTRGRAAARCWARTCWAVRYLPRTCWAVRYRGRDWNCWGRFNMNLSSWRGNHCDSAFLMGLGLRRG